MRKNKIGGPFNYKILRKVIENDKMKGMVADENRNYEIKI